MNEKTKILIAIGILLIVCLLALGVIILTQYNANVIVKNAENDYSNNKNVEINTNTESATFIRTYNVLNVADSNDENYLYLTIRQFQEEEVATVKVQKRLANIVEQLNSYEFTFQYTDNIVEDNVESIFANTILISIKKTDKQGLEQIQDSIVQENIDEYEEIRKANQEAKESKPDENLEEKKKYQEELNRLEQELKELVSGE